MKKHTLHHQLVKFPVADIVNTFYFFPDRSYLRITEQEFVGLPSDVCIRQYLS